MKLARILYPDIADRPKKGVIIKLDGGPGRLDEGMLVNLRLMGAYLFTGIQNSTHVTQETDRNYGAFESGLRNVLDQIFSEKIAAQRVQQ